MLMFLLLITINLLFNIHGIEECSPSKCSNNDNSVKCSDDCLDCSTPAYCNLCISSKINYKGYCLPKCEFPRIPSLNSEDSIECKLAEPVSLKLSEMILSQYSSHDPSKSFYMTFYNSISVIEIRFWLKLDSKSIQKNEQPILIWSQTNNYPFLYEKDSILTLKLKESNLFIEGIKKKIQVEVIYDFWNLVMIYIEFPTEKYSNKLIGISTVAVQESQAKVNVDFEYIPSNELIRYENYLFFGNINKNEANYEIKNFFIIKIDVRSRFIGELIYKRDIFQDLNHFIVKDFETETRVLNFSKEEIPLINSLESYGLIYLINIVISVVDYDLPYDLFTLKIDGETIYEARIIIFNNTVCIYDFGTITELNDTKYSFRIIASKILDGFLVFNKFKASYYKGTNLSLFFNELAVNEKLIQFDSFIFCKNPSVFQSIIFVMEERFGIELSSKSNRKNLRNITFHQVFPRIKNCTGSSNTFYLFSKDECTNFEKNSCHEFGLECVACNLFGCLYCMNSRVIYNGQCAAKCPEYFNSYSSSRICEEMGYTRSYFNGLNRISCLEHFQMCLKNDSCENCGKISFPEHYLRTKSFTSSCELCPESCLNCYLLNSKYICLICEPEYILYNGTCQEKCPDNLFKLKNECVANCPEERHFPSHEEKYCEYCLAYLEGMISLKRCRNPLYFTNFSSNIIPSKDCRLKNGDKCFFCKDNLISFQGACLNEEFKTQILSFSRDTTLSLDRDRYELSPQGLLVKCPKICGDCIFNAYPFADPKKNEIKCVKMKDENQIFSKEIEYKIYNESDHYKYCPEYMEGLTIVYYKEICLKFPNNHYFINIVSSLRFSNFEYFTKFRHNFRVDQIKICNMTNISTILCLYDCPKYFLRNGDNCIYKEPLKEKDSITVDTNYYYHDIEGYSLKNHILFWYNQPELSTAIVLQKNKCPKFCPKCYHTGKKFICLECSNPDMYYDFNDHVCRCKKKFYFDISTSTCVSACRDGLLISEFQCVESCMTNTGTTDGMASLYNYKGKCESFCPKNSEGYVDLIKLDELYCVDNFVAKFLEIEAKFEKAFDTHYQESIWENWNFNLLDLYFVIVDYANQEKIIQSLATTKFDDREESKKLASTILIVGAKLRHMNLILVLHDKMESLLKQMKNDKYFAYKLSYFRLSFFCRPEIFPSTNSSDSKVNFLINEDRKIIMRLQFNKSRLRFNFELPSLNCTLAYNLIETEDYLLFGFRLLKLEIKEYSTTLELEPRDNSSLILTIANTTSDYEEILHPKMLSKLFSQCNYFVLITEKNFTREKISIMIESDILFPTKRTHEKLPEKIDLSYEKNLKIAIVIVFVVIGAPCLYFAYIFYKKKIDDGYKIKFVQLAELEDLEDEKDEVN